MKRIIKLYFRKQNSKNLNCIVDDQVYIVCVYVYVRVQDDRVQWVYKHINDQPMRFCICTICDSSNHSKEEKEQQE